MKTIQETLEFLMGWLAVILTIVVSSIDMPRWLRVLLLVGILLALAWLVPGAWVIVGVISWILFWVIVPSQIIAWQTGAKFEDVDPPAYALWIMGLGVLWFLGLYLP
jgi:ABC-type transport system involved in Fe-S cluster assembly fused permease/ATPase subunit